MGMVHAEITLSNAGDGRYAVDGLIKDSEIRKTTVTALVDTGAVTIVINEEIRNMLGLRKIGVKPVVLADGSPYECDVTEPIDIQWKNRVASFRALVIPDAKYVLLGALPLEDLDLIVHPLKQELVGAHGDEQLGLLL